MLLKIDHILNETDFYKSALSLINKLIFTPSKVYVHNNQPYFNYGEHLLTNLSKTYRELSTNKYQFDEYHCRITKVKYKTRKLYIASWRDKIVENWLAQALNKSLDHWFSRRSYAYRIGSFGLDRCQNDFSKLNKNNQYVVQRDIKQCFYTIPHPQLNTVLKEIIDEHDYLYEIILNRLSGLEIGLPFGSPLACVLANIYLTKLDRIIEKLPVNYFRYADDMLMCSRDYNNITHAQKILDNSILDLGLTSKKSHHHNSYLGDSPTDYNPQNQIKFMGLEYHKNNQVKLSREKQRKIINLFKREHRLLNLQRMSREQAIEAICKVSNEVIDKRIRSVAIIDYYLKHVTDTDQLKYIDLQIAQNAISTILNKKFRNRDFSIISYKKLREKGLPSLFHRWRLHKQGKLRINFIDFKNNLLVKRREESFKIRKSRFDQMQIRKKLKKVTPH